MATTPNMNLTLPTVSQTTGPSWASQINTAFSTIDSHSHTIGNGVAITTAALNIDSDLSFGQNAALSLSSAQFVNQAATPGSNRVYVVNGNLWYSYDGVTPVQITSGSAIVGAPGSITGLVNPAAVVYDPATATFTFYSNQTPPAQLGVLVSSQVRLRASAVANPVTIASSALASTYTLTVPDSAPGSAGIVGFASSGALSAVTANSTLTITSSSISVANGGITSNQLAPSSIITAAIAPQAVTQAKMEAKSVSSSSVINSTIVNNAAYSAVTNSSVTVSLVAGRPVWIWLQSDYGSVGTIGTSNSPLGGNIKVRVTDPSIAYSDIAETTLGNGQTYSPSVVSCAYVPSFTGNHTIQLWAKNNSTAGTPYVLAITNVRMNAFQL
jgi:hypothetical protein